MHQGNSAWRGESEHTLLCLENTNCQVISFLPAGVATRIRIGCQCLKDLSNTSNHQQVQARDIEGDET
jgi:hypothetical protein